MLGLSVAQTLTVDFTLEVGSATDSVTVSSDPPLIETGTAEIGSYVSKKEFDTWPITVGDGRRQIQQFIFTALPGTAGSTWQGSINGGQQYSHEILIDGIAIGRMDLAGGANNEFSPSAETISEFKLQTGTVSAQYTGGQTAVSNFATKSGTNTLHGSAYYYGQNDALRANSFNSNASGVPRQPFKQHNFGYSVAGPVYLPKVYNGKNRTFFYHNIERTKLKDYSQSGFATLPSPRIQEGRFLQPVQGWIHRQRLLRHHRRHRCGRPLRALRSRLRSVNHTASGKYLGSRRVPEQCDSHQSLQSGGVENPRTGTH